MQKNQAVKLNEEAYNKIADDFLLKREYRIDELKFLRKFLKKRDRVLDVGCGWGRLIVAFEGIKINYTGVDQSSASLKIAKKKFHGVTFKKAQMTKLPFEDRKFDKVFCIATFHHLLDSESMLKALGEMRRVLKNGGQVIMTNWNLRGDWRKKKINSGDYLDIGDNNFEVPWKNNTGEIMAKRYYHAFSPLELRKLFTQAGFKIKKQYYEWHGVKSDKKNGANIVSIINKI